MLIYEVVIDGWSKHVESRYLKKEDAEARVKYIKDNSDKFFFYTVDVRTVEVK
jgi:hypothetical protein